MPIVHSRLFAGDARFYVLDLLEQDLLRGYHVHRSFMYHGNLHIPRVFVKESRRQTAGYAFDHLQAATESHHYNERGEHDAAGDRRQR
jgi:hypothetical protein